MRSAEPWLAVLVIMATADALEPKLRLFLERRVSAALTGRVETHKRDMQSMPVPRRRVQERAQDLHFP